MKTYNFRLCGILCSCFIMCFSFAWAANSDRINAVKTQVSEQRASGASTAQTYNNIRTQTVASMPMVSNKISQASISSSPAINSSYGNAYSKTLISSNSSWGQNSAPIAADKLNNWTQNQTASTVNQASAVNQRVDAAEVKADTSPREAYLQKLDSANNQIQQNYAADQTELKSDYDAKVQGLDYKQSLVDAKYQQGLKVIDKMDNNANLNKTMIDTGSDGQFSKKATNALDKKYEQANNNIASGRVNAEQGYKEDQATLDSEYQQSMQKNADNQALVNDPHIIVNNKSDARIAGINTKSSDAQANLNYKQDSLDVNYDKTSDWINTKITDPEKNKKAHEQLDKKYAVEKAELDSKEGKLNNWTQNQTASTVNQASAVNQRVDAAEVKADTSPREAYLQKLDSANNQIQQNYAADQTELKSDYDAKVQGLDYKQSLVDAKYQQGLKVIDKMDNNANLNKTMIDTGSDGQYNEKAASALDKKYEQSNNKISSARVNAEQGYKEDQATLDSEYQQATQKNADNQALVKDPHIIVNNKSDNQLKKIDAMSVNAQRKLDFVAGKADVISSFSK